MKITCWKVAQILSLTKINELSLDNNLLAPCRKKVTKIQFSFHLEIFFEQVFVFFFMETEFMVKTCES